jgi:signal transduction histidine kinase
VGGSLKEEVNQERFFEDRDQNILSVLLLIDGVILLISSASSYVFAGYTLKPIKSIMTRQEQFASDAAHELRTPLAVIQTQIEVLLRGKEPLSNKVKSTLSSVLDETKGLTGITTDLLLLARKDTSVKHVLATSISLGEILEEIIPYIQTSAEEKHITLTLEDRSAAQVYGNRNEIKRIFLNILDNAVKYTNPNGFIQMKIKEIPPDAVTIEIKDDGLGISDNDLPHIFDRFYKAENARHSNGSGLGLSLVKQLIESNEGRITVESKLGKGTAVNLCFKQTK